MTNIRLPELDHIGVFVSDLAKARAFYEQNLGMQFVEEDEDDGVWMVTMRGGDREVHLFKAKAPGVAPHLNHVAYRVSAEELARLQEDLAHRGVAYTGPHRYKDTRFIKLQDPDGLTWEYLCPSS